MRYVFALGLLALTACGSDDAPPAATDQPKFAFATSSDSLYKIDTRSHAVTLVGPMTGCFDVAIVTDVAVDSAGGIFAVSDSLYKVDGASGVCTKVGGTPGVTGLAFLPKGVLDATREVLVGYAGATYVQIDTATGKTVTLGYLAKDQPAITLSSSGDLVYSADKHLYLSVTGVDANGKTCGDCLVEVDPTKGAIVKNYGPIGYSQVYGLAAWDFAVWGFSTDGRVFSAKPAGDTLTVTAQTLPEAGAAIAFGGAASAPR